MQSLDKKGSVVNKKQLYWRCRRGTRELDRMVLTFLDREFDRSTRECQDAFIRLLSLPDPDLYSLLTGAIDTQDPNYVYIRECVAKNTKNAAPGVLT